MNRERFQRARALFAELCECPPQERAERLRTACGGDEDLRACVESLLAIDAQQSEFLSVPAIGGAEFRDLADRSQADLGESSADFPVIRGYCVTGVLGEGGMGVVYEARQEHPRRTVALKVLRSGMASANLVRRFQREAEVLAQLQHPGIAHIYEAGVTGPAGSSGSAAQPYFAMELIRGRPLTEFAEQRRLDTRARLELFTRVCDAVHHAHTKGVVHRDLKPANILVVSDEEEGARTEESGLSKDAPGRGPRSVLSPQHSVLTSAQPKILDFGIARLIGADLATTLQTDIGQLVGTIPYMSPEQVSGRPDAIDARSDVYALGVVIYELLTGRLPYRVRDCPIPEAVRVIREEEPSHLGSAVSALRGDLDTIVAKALEKDLQRRYPSAAELAADIRRFLRDEPIVARPASTFYQLGKFAKRHRGLVAGVCIAFAAMLVGLAGTFTFAVRATQQRRAAQASEAEARRTSYRSSITAASSALRVHDVARARQALTSAPEELRGWEWRHFLRELDNSRLTIRCGPRHWGVRYSSDGLTLLCPTWDMPPRLLRWDSATGEPLADGSPFEAWSAWYRPTRSIAGWDRGVDFQNPNRMPVPDAEGGLRTYTAATLGIPPGMTAGSPAISRDDGVLAICASYLRGDETLVLFDLARGEPIGRPRSLGSGNYVMALSFDGRKVVTADMAGKTLLWDAQSPQPVATFSGHTDRVIALAIDSRCERLVTGSWDTTLRLWDVSTAACLAVAVGHSDQVQTLALSPDERLIASGGKDGTVRLWEMDSLALVRTLRGHDAAVISVAFSPEGHGLVSADEKGAARVWDIAAGGKPDVLRGHTSYVYPVCWSLDGQTLASGAWDRTVRVWNLRDQEAVAVLPDHPGHLYQVAFSPDGRRVAAADDTSRVSVWDVAERRLIGARHRPEVHTAPLGFHRDGRRVHIGWVSESAVLLWDPGSEEVEEAAVGVMREVHSPLVSPDRRFAMRVPAPNQLVDLAAGRVLWELTGQESLWTSRSGPVSYTPDGKLLAGVRSDGRIGVWETLTGRRAAEIADVSEAFAVAFSPDGARLAVSGRHPVIYIFDTANFEPIAQLRGHTSYVWSLAWSPDGQRLISGSGDHTVRLWDGG